MTSEVIVLTALVMAFVVLPLVFVLALELFKKKTQRDTQRIISDPDLLRLIDSEPDQMVTPHRLADKTDLTLNEARSRLSTLMMQMVLSRSVGGTRHYYALKEPLPEDKQLKLSPDPFLTVEDLMLIFEAHHFRVSTQDLIMATGLPLSVIKREMKHFKKKGIVQSIRGYAPHTAVLTRFYVLQEPYRSQPEKFRSRAEELDLELKEILLNENLLV